MDTPSDESQTLLNLYRLLRAADRLAQHLPESAQSRTTDEICDLHSRLLEDIVKQKNPRTTEDVRALEPEYRGEGVVYLIDGHLRGREPAEVPFWKVDAWKEWLRNLGTECHADQLLSDRHVRTPEDVIGWFCSHEQRLFPNMEQEKEAL